ncbi:MAG: HAD family hydrolase [Bacillota bacterium]|nr:HAD family phosphatase [Candidatus Fermentithermobacillaceae bacterium]
MLDFEAAIFDLDGTLLDSMGVWHEIDIEFLGRRGIDVPGEYISAVNSKGFRETAEFTIEYFNLDVTPEELMDEWFETAVDKYSRKVRLKPSAREYLIFLKEHGIKLGTATSLPRMLAEPALKNNRIYHLFDAFTTTDEAGRSKEYPDVYLLAAKRLGVPPGNCIVFEDILPGIKAVRAAGMRPYGVYDKSSEHHRDEIKALSEIYIRDFGEILHIHRALCCKDE